MKGSAFALSACVLGSCADAGPGAEKKTITSTAKVRAHLLISGRVQGVGFRASTEEEAQRLGGITGWVKNLQDGRVEAVIQGPKDKVDALVKWCHKGPPTAIVEKVEVTWESTVEDFKDFRTRF